MKDLATSDLPPVTHQRARGSLRLQTKLRPGGQSYGAVVRQQGASRLLFPRTAHTHVEAVTLNTAGGITGGDDFRIEVEAEAGSRLTLTTQAAERVYRAAGATPGKVRTTLEVGAGARLCWLPQETILFDGCALDRQLEVDLDPTASFLMVESLVFGRTASGETIRDGRLYDTVRIRCAGQLIYLDRVRLDGAIDDQLARPAVAAGAKTMASLVLFDADAALQLDAVRDLLPATGGASLLADNLLVMRVIADDSFALRQTLIPVLTHLTQNALPKTWSL